MAQTKEKYISPEGLALELRGSDYRAYRTIIDHEISGLKSLGSAVTFHDTHIEISNPNTNAFYNRIIDIDCTDDEFSKIVEKHKKLRTHTSFVITPFSKPELAEQILIQHGAKHVLSSLVFGKEVSSANTKPHYDQVKQISNPEEEDFITLFASFFGKADESLADIKNRLQENIKNGPHLVFTSEGKAVALMGCVVFQKTASVYCCVVSPDCNNPRVVPILASQMTALLGESGVSFVYVKTRNKSVISHSRIFGLEQMYTEHVYEFKYEI